MYLCYFSDTDLGDGNDDLTGCDTVLSLAFTYNGKPIDAVYGSECPADGYDYFQGPIVKGDPTDVANWNFGKRSGYRNLGMTALSYYINGAGADYSDPTQGDAAGAGHWYNFMRGLGSRSGNAMVNPKTNKVTTFAFSGDPVTGQGWIDGIQFAPADRRHVQSSGPFSMVPGDTQEVVIGTIIGLGGDRMSSISVLKFYDLQAQSAYNNNFNVATPPPTPKVTAAELSNAVSLYWGGDGVDPTESSNKVGYAFEGYNVYQLPQAASLIADAKRIATYDLPNGVKIILDDYTSGVLVTLPAQYGSDNGLQHYIKIDHDYINDRPLVNGQHYFFAVTAYTYNPDPTAVPSQLENTLNAIEVVPQSLKPGYTATSTLEQVVPVTITPGVKSDAVANVTVVDPTRTTGNSYQISFDTAAGNYYWKLVNTTTGKTLVAKNTNLTGDYNYPTIDGLLFRISAPLRPDGTAGEGLRDDNDPDGNMGFSWITASDPPYGSSVRFINPQTATTSWNFQAYGVAWGLYNSVGWPGPTSLFPGTSVQSKDVKTVDIRFSSDKTKWSKAYRFLRGSTTDTSLTSPAFYPFIINKYTGSGTGYPYQDIRDVPFTVWDVDATPARQLNVGFMESNTKPPGGKVDGQWRPTAATDGGREFLFIFASTYSATPLTQYTTGTGGVPLNIYAEPRDLMYWGCWVDRTTRPFPQDAGANVNTTLRLIPYYPVSRDVKWTFTAPAPLPYDATLAKTDINSINVFPNPYFGFQQMEQSRYVRFITFNHLPPKATIRIFTVSGNMVQTLQKNDATQFINWDLKNWNGLFVASGMYIAYIDMPDIGAKKILKIAVIMEAQFLDRN
jgi:hypothetical protein